MDSGVEGQMLELQFLEDIGNQEWKVGNSKQEKETRKSGGNKQRS